MATTTDDLDFDALNSRYAEERAKRLRDDAVDQFIEVKTEAADLDRDYYADPDFKRDPIVEDTDALVIGGGFAGLLAGARLREQGIKDLRIVEKGGGFGGTWYWNRYPGVSCDIESYIYLPMLEELGVMPSEKYSKGTDIRAHCELIARTYDLHRAALFQTVVRDLRWNEDRQRWIVKTSRGDEIAARFIISCTGVLSNPKLPKIPGIASFNGHSFHTSRWDYGYTGGDPDKWGPMPGLKDKKVAIIGTGATSVQAIPYTAEAAQHLYIFQRTPTSIDARGNKPTDPDWVRSLKPGWAKERRNNFTFFCAGIGSGEDMVNDGWTDIVKHISAPPGTDPSAIDPVEIMKGGMRKMERTRQRVDEVVKDKATAEALKPYYYYFCKRPGFHDGFLETFNRSNVTLVDTEGKGVEAITEKGIVANGKEYEVDCIIYATGFDWFNDYTHENGMEFYGRGGLPLSKHWEDGPRTLYGVQTHGFPNFLFMRQAQSGSSYNYTHTADEQTKHIAYIVAESLRRGYGAVEPTAEAEQAWVDEIVNNAGLRKGFMDVCTPGYYNFEGKYGIKVARNEFYIGGPKAYNDLLENWREEGHMKGLEVSAGK
jgi:cyclohexanone monooxygenase